MFAKRIDDAVKKEKIITERFFEPSRSAWPERALMLQTVKKKLSRKDSSSRIEVHGRPWHLCYKPLKKLSRRDSSSRIEVHGRYGHSCYKPLKKLSRKNSSSRLEVHGQNGHSCDKTVKTSKIVMGHDVTFCD